MTQHSLPVSVVTNGRKRTLLWVNTTYFAEGLPFMIVRILSAVFLTQIGVKERYLGLLNLLGLPWNGKFLWAPLIDGLGTKKWWQVWLQVALGAMTCALGTLAYFAGASSDPLGYLTAIVAIFCVMAVLAATNDIAIDGFYLEAIPARSEQALLSGYRVLAYRLAMVFARSGLVGVVAWLLGSGMAANTYEAWAYSFAVAGMALIVLAGLHAYILPDTQRGEVSGGSKLQRASVAFREGVSTYLHQPKICLILLFIVLYKVGDELLFSMVTPFLLREIGIATEQYAWIGGIVGAGGTIVGAMLGGVIIKKMGLRRALWPLTILMNANIWLYVWLSISKPNPMTLAGITTIATVHGIEQIAAGLGSAALLVFLLTTCSHQYKATHYAIGSAIMSIPATAVGSFGGLLVEWIGYTNLYIIAFFAAIPGMLLIPFVPIKEE